jgi:DNA-directed RNA polymerase subunit alpha
MRIRWRGLELPTRVARDEQASKPTYGRFIVEPFERGFGTTIGNSLRRILLSSLEGAAVTHVKIETVDHEFTALPGVVEDVTVIILNIKSLIVRLATETPKTMRVSVKGKTGESTEIRAAMIEADPAIEIVNKDQLLATLTGDVEFKMEMTVGRGRGYATADENKPEGDQIIGLIPVDSVYSPVTRVRYRVEDTRVGQRTNYDRLVMEIWTNGTITPEMALVEAAKILRKHVNTFVQYFEMGSGLAVDGAQAESEGGGIDGTKVDESVLTMPISSLDLSVRASNCLASANISTVGALIGWEESGLLKIRSFGKTSLREIKRKLADLGLALRSDKGAATDDTGEEDIGEDDQFDVEDKVAPMGDYLAGPGSPPSAPLGEYPVPPPAAPPAAADSNAPADKEVGVPGEATA